MFAPITSGEVSLSEELGSFASTIHKRTYALTPDETWDGTARRVAKFVANGDQMLEERFYKAIRSRKLMPGGRYLYAAGRPIPQTTNCFLKRAEDNREDWGQLLNESVQALTTGGGVGIEYSRLRPKGSPIKRFGGEASGPVSLMMMVNEVARHVMAGGKRRSALWAGLNWQHPDINLFLRAKDWELTVRGLKEKDFNFPAALDMTNISVGLDDAFFDKVGKEKAVRDLYLSICRRMCKTGEPGFSINIGEQANHVLRNPCTEVVSDTDGDCCNLASVNFARIRDMNELEEITDLAVRFLYFGTYVGWLPHQTFQKVREGNRRIGLGLLGLHEWCLKHGQKYEPTTNLGNWLSIWKQVSEHTAKAVSEAKNGPYPAGLRAIAPTGTIGILAETTTSIEPILYVACKRRFLEAGGKWKASYIIDPTARRLIEEEGIRPHDIEDAYTLAHDIERRIAMQAFVQDYVDQAISSTINLPEWGEPGNNDARQFANILLKYLPRLRGITVYPDGARPGQPISPIAYDEAKAQENVIFEESAERCQQGVCGV